VLQRIAIVYLVVAWLVARTSARTQLLVAVAALSGYWAALMLLPLPGAGANRLSEMGNVTALIDAWLFGRHMAHASWDPEGLLSTIPAIATSLGGVFAVTWLFEGAGQHRTMAVWAAGLTATLAGLLWNTVFPINKNLWTSSFALFSAGIAAQIFAFLHWLVELHPAGWWTAPFVAFGRNALAAYLLSVAVDSALTRWVIPGDDSLKAHVYEATFGRWIAPCCGPESGSLAYAVTYVALWAVLFSLMSRRRIFIAI
jgi:predicted acyltransferase